MSCCWATGSGSPQCLKYSEWSIRLTHPTQTQDKNVLYAFVGLPDLVLLSSIFRICSVDVQFLSTFWPSPSTKFCPEFVLNKPPGHPGAGQNQDIFLDIVIEFKIDTTWLMINSRQKLYIDKIRANTGYKVSGFLLYFIYFVQNLDVILLHVTIWAKHQGLMGFAISCNPKKSGRSSDLDQDFHLFWGTLEKMPSEGLQNCPRGEGPEAQGQFWRPEDGIFSRVPRKKVES